MTLLTDRAARGFADRLANAAAADGLSPIAGRLFAVFLLSDQPQSLDAHIELYLLPALVEALQGRQLQPLLLGPRG